MVSVEKDGLWCLSKRVIVFLYVDEASLWCLLKRMVYGVC
jgi:hypothetical protein